MDCSPAQAACHHHTPTLPHPLPTNLPQIAHVSIPQGSQPSRMPALDHPSTNTRFPIFKITLDIRSSEIPHLGRLNGLRGVQHTGHMIVDGLVSGLALLQSLHLFLKKNQKLGGWVWQGNSSWVVFNSEAYAWVGSRATTMQERC